MKIGRPAYERNHLWRCRTRSCYRFGPGPDQHTDEDDGYSYFVTHDSSIESLRAVVETCGHSTTRSIVLPAEYLGMVGNRDGLVDGGAFMDIMTERRCYVLKAMWGDGAASMRKLTPRHVIELQRSIIRLKRLCRNRKTSTN